MKPRLWVLVFAAALCSRTGSAAGRARGVILLEHGSRGQDYRLVEAVPGRAPQARSGPLHCAPTTLALSPDGEAAVVIAWSPDALLVVALGSGQVTRIPAPKGTYFSGAPRWSPAGGVIACVAEENRAIPPGGQGSARIMPWEAGRQRLESLTGSLSRAEELAWSPDGRDLAFIGPDGLEVISASGGRPTMLVPSARGAGPPGRGGYPHLPAWSPDGRQIAFLRFFGPSGGRSEQLALVVVDRRTRKTRELHRSSRLGQGPAWSPDGRYLMVSGHAARAGHTGVDGETVVFEAASGKQVSFPNGHHFVGQSWSPDGEAILGMDAAAWTTAVPQLSWAIAPFPDGKKALLQTFSGLDMDYMGRMAAWLPQPLPAGRG